MKINYDVIIIGAGAAGMTAAIYIKRANLTVCMIERSAPGGQINQTAHIENYPGFDKIDGPSLSMKMFTQTQNLGIEYKYGDVLEISNKGDIKLVKTDKEELTAKAVIICTGRKSRSLKLENENKFIGRGISWCAICDGPLYKEKEVCIVGGGNSACEEALYLSDIASKVTIIHRRDAFRADPAIRDKVLNSSKIEKIWDSNVTKLNDKDEVLESIEVTNNKTNETQTVFCKGLFIYIGSDPVTKMVENYNITDKNGYILVDENNRTKENKLYAAGDVVKKELYQISTAVGEGSKAAMSAVMDIIE